MASPTERQIFRETVALVAAAAKAKLPAAVNGRVESAVKLVLLHDVTPQADGAILVGSSTDPLKTYRLEGTSCTCQDFVYGKDTEGWCAHRIAAGIHKRVQQLLAAEPAPEVILPEEMDGYPDNDVPEEPMEQPPTPPPLPEAPASANVHVMIAGRDVLVTLRDHDEVQLLARLRTLLDGYPVAERPAGQGEAPPQCKYHGPLKASTKAPGTFYCTKKLADGSYCPSRYPEREGR